jgi:hypothetical protein
LGKIVLKDELISLKEEQSSMNCFRANPFIIPPIDIFNLRTDQHEEINQDHHFLRQSSFAEKVKTLSSFIAK